MHRDLCDMWKKTMKLQTFYLSQMVLEKLPVVATQVDGDMSLILRR